MRKSRLLLRSYHLSQEQDDKLGAYARKEGITKGEAFRRIVHPGAFPSATPRVPVGKMIRRTFEVDEERDFTLEGRACGLGILKDELVRRILDDAFAAPSIPPT